MNAEQSTATLFLQFSRDKLLGQYWPRMRKCVESLTDDQIWWRPNGASNSVGNLLLHLNGNVRQWLIASFSGLDDKRNRPAEFNAPEKLPGARLVEQLDGTLQEAAKVLSGLTEADLVSRFEIQGYDVTGLQAVYQVVEHFGLHHGQILYITKMLRGEDLGFYRELTQAGRTSGETRP